MRFFICGSALRGQPDHASLGDAKFLGEIRTAPRYRLHSVAGKHPGIYEAPEDGVAILGELYEMTDEQHDALLAVEPPNLYEGDVILEDESTASAMLYPRSLIEKNGDEDISGFGSWAAFKASRP